VTLRFPKFGWLASRLLLGLLLVGLSGTARADEAWYRIAGPDGAVIGWQHEADVAGAGSTRQITERQLFYRVDDHEPVRQYLRREIVRDEAGRMASQTLQVGSDAGSARSFDPRTATDEVHLGTLIAAAKSDEASGLPDGLHAVERAGSRIVMERLRGGGFDGAWIVQFGASGDLDTVVQPMLGASMTFTPSGPVGAADISPHARMPHPMAPSPYDITLAAKRGHIRYRFGLPKGLQFNIPETGDQRVSRSDDEVTLDVCGGCNAPMPQDMRDLDRLRQPARWIESDFPALRGAAKRAVRPGMSAWQAMKALERVARERLSGVDYQGQYSAKQAWNRRKGDCTEDAVLLAGLARAAGFPAQVASGLVYARERYHGTHDAFLPHAWTLVWIDGAWRSFDISVDGFDATHIALAVGDGEPQSIVRGWRLAAMLDWRSLAQVKSAFSPR